MISPCYEITNIAKSCFSLHAISPCCDIVVLVAMQWIRSESQCRNDNRMTDIPRSDNWWLTDSVSQSVIISNWVIFHLEMITEGLTQLELKTDDWHKISVTVWQS